MDRWEGRVALVTGASAGIGYAVAEMLVKGGMTVIGCARNIKPIQELAERLESEKGKLVAVKCDLSKEGEILAMFGDIKSKFTGVDVCVNNAGISHEEPIFTGSTENWRNMLDVNVMALCLCSKLAMQSMQERSVDDGHIIHLSSMSGHRVVPGKGTFYAATKFAVRALLEGMRTELRRMGSHIRVTAISPGVVETEFASRATDPERAKALYSGLKCLEAKDVADAVHYVLSAPPHVQVHDILMRPTEQSF